MAFFIYGAAMPFNVTAQLQLQGPANLRPVIASIQNGLRNIQAEVNVTINPAGLSSLANLNRQLAQIQATLSNVAGATGGAVNAINNVTTATTNASGANTQYAASSAKVITSNKAIAAAFDEGSSAAENFGKAAGLAARRYTAFLVAGGAIVGLIQGIKDATSEAFQFERELVRLNQVGAGTRADIKGIEDEITRLSTSLGVSSKDLAQASVTLAQAGLSAKQTKEALEALAQAALSPNFGKMSDTVEGAIAVMSQFRIESKDLGQALGAMNAVAAGFAVESKDLIDAVKRAGGAFRSTGGDLNEFLALFTSVRATTRESGEAIATGLRTIFTRLQRNDTVESLKSLGIELRRSRTEALALGDTKLEGQFVGAYEAVRRLSEALKSIPGADPRFSAIIEQLGGYRQISRVIPLIQEFAKANEALTVAQLGQFSLQDSTNKAQEATIIRIEKLRQQFLALFRTITESKGFQVFLDILLHIGEALNSVANIATNLIPLFGALAAVKIGTSLVSLTAGLGTGLFGGVQQSRGIVRRASGGIVPGHGDGDTVPALLEPGEYVIRKRAVQAIGADNLAQLNKGGSVRAYAEGSPGRVLTITELENLRRRIANKDPLADKFIGLYTGISTPQGIRQFKDRLVRNEEKFEGLPRGLGQTEKTVKKVKTLVNSLTLPFGQDTVGMLTLGGADEAGFKLVEGAEAIGKSNQLAQTALNLRDVKLLRTGVNVHVLSKTATGKFIGEYENQVEPALQTLFPANSGVKLDLDKQAKRTISGYLFESFIGGVAGLEAGGSQETFDFPGNLTSSRKYAKLAPHVYPAIKPGELIDTKRVSNISKTAHDIAKKYLNYTTNNKKLFGILGLQEAEVVKALAGDSSLAKLAGGGLINGINALLTPGEFVVDKSAVARHGLGLMNQLNNVQGFAAGGPVARLLPSARIGQIYGSGEDESGGTAGRISLGDSTRYPGFIGKIAGIAKLNINNPGEKARATEIADKFDVEGSVFGYSMKKDLFDNKFATKVEAPIFNAVNKVIVPQYGLKPITPKETGRGFASSLSGFIFQRFLETFAPLQAASKEDAPFDFVNPGGRLHQFDDVVGKDVNAQYIDAKRNRQSPGTILRKALAFENSRLIDIEHGTPIINLLTEQEKKTRLARIATQRRVAKATGFATGGLVPSLLTPGEYIVPKSTVGKYGTGFFNRLNAGGQVRGFATGGRFQIDPDVEAGNAPNPARGIVSAGLSVEQALLKIAAILAKRAPDFVGPPRPTPGQAAIRSPITGDPTGQAPYTANLLEAFGIDATGGVTPVQRPKPSALAGPGNPPISFEQLAQSRAQIDIDRITKRAGGISEGTKEEVLAGSRTSLLRELAGSEEKRLQPNTLIGAIASKFNGGAAERRRIAEEAALKALAGEADIIIKNGVATLALTQATQKAAKAVDQEAASANKTTIENTALAGAKHITTGAIQREGSAANATSKTGPLGPASGGGGGLSRGLIFGALASTLLPLLTDSLGGQSKPSETLSAEGKANFQRNAGISGGVTGALTGATTGSFILPGIGTAIGAVVGGLFGFAQSIGDAKKQIQEIEIGKTLAKVNDALEEFSTGNLSAVGQKGLLENLRKQEEQAATKSRFNTVDKGVLDFITLGNFDTNKREADALKSARSEIIGPTLIASNKALAAAATKVGTASGRALAESGASLDNDPKRIQRLVTSIFDNPINRKAIENLVTVGGKTQKEAIDIVTKGTLGAERGEFVAAQARLSQAANQELLQSFSRLADAVQNTTVQIAQLSVASEATAGAFENRLGGVNIRGTAERLSAGTNLPGFEQLLGQVTAPLGAGGQRLQGAGLALSQVENALTQAITQAISKGPGAFQGEGAAESIGSTIRNIASDRLTGGRGGFEALPKDIQAILLPAISRATALGPEKFQIEGKTDASLLARILLEDSKPVRDALAKIGKDLEDNANRFINQLAENQRRLQIIGEAEDKTAQIRGQRVRVVAEQLASRQGIQGGGLSLLTRGEAEAPLISRQQRLVSGTRVAQGEAFDPKVLGEALIRVQGDLREAAVAQQAELKPGRAAEEFSRLQGEAGKLTAALKFLTDTTERNAYAQERLNSINQDRQARVSFGQRLATASPEELERLNRGVGLAAVANQQGSVRGFVPEDRKLIFEVLNQLGGAKLPGLGFGGRSGTGVAERLGGEIVPLAGKDEIERSKLEASIIKGFDVAAQANIALTTGLTTANDKLIDDLRKLQADFFRQLGQNAANVIPRAIGGLIPNLSIAGTPKKGTDTVPALLTPGEYVVNAKQAGANAELLKRINSGNGPVTLAGGGTVTPYKALVEQGKNTNPLDLDDYQLNTLYRKAYSFLGPYYASQRKQLTGKKNVEALGRLQKDIDDFSKTESDPSQLSTAKKIELLNRLPRPIQENLFQAFSAAKDKANEFKVVSGDALKSQYITQLLPTIANQARASGALLNKANVAIDNATENNDLGKLARLLPVREQLEQYHQRLQGLPITLKQAQEFDYNRADNKELIVRSVKAIQAGVALENADIQTLLATRKAIVPPAARAAAIQPPTAEEKAASAERVAKARAAFGDVLPGQRAIEERPGLLGPKPPAEFAEPKQNRINLGDNSRYLAPGEQAERVPLGAKKAVFTKAKEAAAIVASAETIQEAQENLTRLRDISTANLVNLERANQENKDATIEERRISIDASKAIFLEGQKDFEEAKRQYRERGVDVKALGFAKGGAVPGISGGDNVRALLSPGEFVLTRNARAMLGDNFLNGANRFAAGGAIGGVPSSPVNVAGLSELSIAMSAFTSPANALASALTGFGGLVNQLTDSLGRIPQTIHMEATHQVNVIINGAEALAQLEPSLQKMVISLTTAELDKMIESKFPDAGHIVR